jgi:hypothetical protein
MYKSNSCSGFVHVIIVALLLSAVVIGGMSYIFWKNFIQTGNTGLSTTVSDQTFDTGYTMNIPEGWSVKRVDAGSVSTKAADMTVITSPGKDISVYMDLYSEIPMLPTSFCEGGGLDSVVSLETTPIANLKDLNLATITLSTSEMGLIFSSKIQQKTATDDSKVGSAPSCQLLSGGNIIKEMPLLPSDGFEPGSSVNKYLFLNLGIKSATLDSIRDTGGSVAQPDIDAVLSNPEFKIAQDMIRDLYIK